MHIVTVPSQGSCAASAHGSASEVSDSVVSEIMKAREHIKSSLAAVLSLQFNKRQFHPIIIQRDCFIIEPVCMVFSVFFHRPLQIHSMSLTAIAHKRAE